MFHESQQIIGTPSSTVVKMNIYDFQRPINNDHSIVTSAEDPILRL